MTVRILIGDCMVRLKELPDNSVDSCVCDPPYHLTSIVKRFSRSHLDVAAHKDLSKVKSAQYKRLAKGFMGQQWDGGDVAFQPETWAEVLRVLKPGGHLVAFSGTRTYHRMAVAIEDAGFEVRDMIAWHYGSGFPKSHDISKAIDKTRRRDFVIAAVEIGVEIPGNSLHDWTKAEHSPGDKWWEQFKAALPEETWAAIERKVLGERKVHRGVAFSSEGADVLPITAPATDAAREWAGWGTALKPATEPICLARKPISEPSIAANVLKWGTGALNIDGCRIEASASDVAAAAVPTRDNLRYCQQDGKGRGEGVHDMSKGRWPANLCHDGSDEVVAGFPVDSGGSSGPRVTTRHRGKGWKMSSAGEVEAIDNFGDSGSAARFFAQFPQPNTVLRQAAQEALDLLVQSRRESGKGPTNAEAMLRLALRPQEEPTRFLYCSKTTTDERGEGNNHPTVKPVALMRWLVRLVTPTSVWYCPSCEGGHSDSTKTACSVTSVRGLPGDVQATGQPACGPVLQPNLCGKSEADTEEELRALRDGLQAGQTEQPVLQPHLFSSRDGSQEAQARRSEDGERLRPDPSAGSPDGEPRGLCVGASAGDGASVGEEPDSERGRPSHQRAEGRQSAGKSGIDGQEPPRQTSEAEAQADPMPALQRNDRGQRSCPACSGTLSRRAGVVLDPFMGSGSTALACDAEQFDFIGCELSPEYAAIAERRIRDAAGMFADVKVAA